MNKEFEIIKNYFLPLTNGCKTANNLLEDVAIINLTKGQELVVSKDLMIEDVHFKRADGAYNIASKLLRVNLSDLASFGAKPLYYLLGFSQNSQADEKFISEFCLGLQEVGKKYQISLIGGDSVSSPDRLFFSITIFGLVKKNQGLKRNKARQQDSIFVSGYIGDAFLGLGILQNKIKCPLEKFRNYLINRHLHPTPRIELGKSLLRKKISRSAIDISDGLLADLGHICQASKLNATIYQKQIPLSMAAKFCLENNPDLNLIDLISGGDDYELLFSTKSKLEVARLSKNLDLPLTEIGFFEKNLAIEQINLLDNTGRKLLISKYGYQHY